MRIDGGTKASGGQQAQSRFEQAMARELSRSGGGKTSTESNIRTDLSAATSKRKAPGSERVGTDFKATEAGKILKGLQDATRQVLSKTMGQAGEAAKGAFAKLAAAAEGAMGKAKAGAQAFGEGMAKAGLAKEGAAFGKEGATAGKSGPGEGAGLGKGGAGEGTATVLTGKDGGAAAQTSGPSGTAIGTSAQAQGDGPRTGGPAGAQASTPSGPATTPTQGAGTERAATATTPAPAEAPGAAPATTTTGAEASAAQDGRAAALAAQNSPVSLEVAAFLQNPWLQSAARKAAANGAELSMVFQLGTNVHGAEFVSIATDDTGFITGPEIEIALTQGAVDTNGNWVAQRGEGMLKGANVTLEPDADGCVFVSDGEPDNPATVTAQIIGAEALHADVVAVRKVR